MEQKFWGHFCIFFTMTRRHCIDEQNCSEELAPATLGSTSASTQQYLKSSCGVRCEGP